MIRHIYLDNFRGFRNTTIKLLSVNFLVGENSTGKTSLLDLLRVLSDPTFFMGPSFANTQEARFGHFNEIVSAHSNDKSYFRVGLVEENAVPHDRSHGGFLLIGTLLTYVESLGVPTLSCLTQVTEASKIVIIFRDEKIFFKVSENQDSDISSDASRLFHRLQSEQNSSMADLVELKFPPGTRKQGLPIYILLHWAVDQAKLKKAVLNASRRSFFSFGERLIWIAPIRTKPRRTYDEPHITFSSEGSHTPYTIRRMLGSEAEAKRFGAFMRRVGKASGLFQAIEIKRYGKSDDAPFEVDAILDGTALNLSWVGYGVSQSLPIFVELLDSRKGSAFAIQQPEVHLHPKAQAALGDIFFEMAARDRKRFVIETHSDFTIDRFRLNFRNKRNKKPDSQVLFFERNEGYNTVTPLLIGTGGELPDTQPEGYRKFFLREEMRVLGF